MLKSHERFYSKDGKRLILIVDDEQINREMLAAILQDQYEIMMANDGADALEIIRNNNSILSLVILDLMMPKLTGMDLLKILKNDDVLRRIPVIVLTSDKSAEVTSLNMGASDFITKPYDVPDIIRARVQRTIELGEDTYIIQSTERDELTGLLNKEFFYRYSEQYDLHHTDAVMNAVIVDVNNFHLVNETRGRIYGDAVLKAIGRNLMDFVSREGGVAGRGDADTFMLYLPEGTDYDRLYKEISESLADENNNAQIRVRLGIYSEHDEDLEIERCFDRAKVAGDMIRNNYSSFISVYDSALHKKELLAQRLILEMDKALEEKQFEVYYQPKYDVTGEVPHLRSAEALVRWKHPELGMISPGLFIPLFEANGLIQRLDRYVWKEAAYHMKKWREEFGRVIPVSVNISRIDMYDEDLVPYIRSLTEECGIDPKDYFLEITESAYTENSDQLVEKVKELRGIGFPIEMDDFGSGYSSLNMLAELPVDVIKLDMRFIRNLHSGEKKLHMVRLVMNIASFLGCTVVAEGVETEEQLMELKNMGCHRVQGKYFSMPVPEDKFTDFIKEDL